MVHRLSELRGMRISAAEGAAGLLNDVLFAEGDLRPRYVAIDAGERFPGRRILVAASQVILLDDGTMRVDLAREQLRRCISTDRHSRLVSGRALRGYRVEGGRGPIGQAEDLLVNADWSLAGVVLAVAGQASGDRRCSSNGIRFGEAHPNHRAAALRSLRKA
jgi:hypothetical protein